VGGCPCVHHLGRLATGDALAGWYQALDWRQRRQLHLAAQQLAAEPRWVPPTWTWGLGRRLFLAALLLWFLLLAAPLLHR
jgi:hypothetical protein